MRQMACHPDLVLKSKTNAKAFQGNDEFGEATVCRLCNDIAEDAIQSKCRHIFDRECIKQYLGTIIEDNVGRHMALILHILSLLNIAKLPCLSFAIDYRLGSPSSGT